MQHDKRLKVWCNECKHLICSTCALSKQHQGHNVCFFEEIRALAEKELEETMKDSNSIHLKAMENAMALEESIKQMEKVSNFVF